MHSSTPVSVGLNVGNTNNLCSNYYYSLPLLPNKTIFTFTHSLFPTARAPNFDGSILFDKVVLRFGPCQWRWLLLKTVEVGLTNQIKLPPIRKTETVVSKY